MAGGVATDEVVPPGAGREQWNLTRARGDNERRRARDRFQASG